jgi:hypothetical protein
MGTASSSALSHDLRRPPVIAARFRPESWATLLVYSAEGAVSIQSAFRM